MASSNGRVKWHLPGADVLPHPDEAITGAAAIGAIEAVGATVVVGVGATLAAEAPQPPAEGACTSGGEKTFG